MRVLCCPIAKMKRDAMLPFGFKKKKRLNQFAFLLIARVRQPSPFNFPKFFQQALSNLDKCNLVFWEINLNPPWLYLFDCISLT